MIRKMNPAVHDRSNPKPESCQQRILVTFSILHPVHTADRSTLFNRARLPNSFLAVVPLESSRMLLCRPRYFFGGGGLGTPVVSYAPLSILTDVLSLMIIVAERYGKTDLIVDCVI